MSAPAQPATNTDPRDEAIALTAVRNALTTNEAKDALEQLDPGKYVGIDVTVRITGALEIGKPGSRKYDDVDAWAVLDAIISGDVSPDASYTRMVRAAKARPEDAVKLTKDLVKGAVAELGLVTRKRTAPRVSSMLAVELLPAPGTTPAPVAALPAEAA